MQEESNPYRSPEAEPVERGGSAAASPKPLGSLAQSARGKEIKQAQWILIAIGVLTALSHGFLLSNIPNEVEQAVRQNNVDPAQVEEFRQTVTMFGYLVYGAGAMLGLLFIALGAMIKKRPVPIAITGLVLYLLATAAFALLNPMSLAKGLIVKILVVLALFRAIRAARAYQSHAEESELVGEPLG